MPQRFIRQFLQLESASGILLFLTTVLALILSNSFLSGFYQKTLQAPSVLFFINEGVMTFFFLLVGLELKREFLVGELSGLSNVVLPSIAAAGGMLVPALIYLAINFHQPGVLKGWAIPVATDIAFALGVLSLFGKRVPLGLKLFLMALAIFDDLGAIIIIAIFYSAPLLWLPFFLSIVLFVMLLGLNFLGMRSLAVYLLVGMLLWVCVLKSGIHATVAGVLLACVIPLQGKHNASPLKRLESKLHPWVAFGVMPVFALVNAGLSLHTVTLAVFTHSVTLGVVLGLLLGKQLGVFSFTWMAVRLKWAVLPVQTSWLELYGVALLCGIGFTMSLFLGNLAFQGSQSHLTSVRLGVLCGSILSGVLGVIVLHLIFQKKWVAGERGSV